MIGTNIKRGEKPMLVQPWARDSTRNGRKKEALLFKRFRLAQRAVIKV
jgi:hypothetical protein